MTAPMWILPMSLRAKMALVTLLGIFFIPFATSDLRGLTHVLSCQDEVTASLFIENPVADETILLSADSTDRDTEGLGLCGGLEVDLQVVGVAGNTADVFVSITNTSEHDWQGTVDLDLGGTAVPVAIGAIDSGATETDTIGLHIRPGETYEITGRLLVGP